MDATVPATILRHFTLKASNTSVHAEANAHSADWLLRIFVNELAPPHARSQQGKCVQQCRRILAYTVGRLKIPSGVCVRNMLEIDEL